MIKSILFTTMLLPSIAMACAPFDKKLALKVIEQFWQTPYSQMPEEVKSYADAQLSAIKQYKVKECQTRKK